MTRLPKKDCRECGESFAPDMMSGPRCRPCASKKAHEKRVGDTYGLAPGQYDELLAFQGGVSAISKQKPGLKRLAVDHDHACCPGPVSCGKCVRGLLTKHENFYLIGWLERFEDPFAVLEAAAEYLRNPPARQLFDVEPTPM